MAVELVEGYRWVIVSLLAHILLIQWMGIQVGGARKRYGVPYPTMYAAESESCRDAATFNCVQRGHQNCLEFLPTFMAFLLLGGLQYPRAAAALGAAYSVARLQYFRGYSTGVPAARFQAGGKLHGFCLLGLLVCSFAFALHQFFPAYI